MLKENRGGFSRNLFFIIFGISEDDSKGQAHDYSLIVSEFALNTIAEFVCSKRYKYNEPMFTQLRGWITNGASALEYFNFYLSGTLFKYYLRLSSDSENIWSTNFNAFNEYMKSLIEERKETFDANNCKDMIDCWLKECLDNPNHEYIKCE
ncbi:hypothetical protein B4U80_14925 [Leptotrombidium deliense]|uniref:Uncharacterized protein n=1 Tax=Leptotrombidium deliense TaxID=299467 RepID=A0A443S0M5_9ACAR|nr:hypothetical protein B4U80_14925 [Leptotrombidium deliense]